MCRKLFNESACAILSLTTRLAWTPDIPQPMSRKTVRRMLETGALEGLVLRDTPGIEEACFERASALLRRVSDVYAGMEAYRQMGYRLLLPDDEGWPEALCSLGSEAPLFLFEMGEKAGCSSSVAVAGSRRILSETRSAAQQTGRMIAEAGAVLITGGAEGVDTAALHGALEADGRAVIVPAMPVTRLMEYRTIRRAMESGRMTILCDALPDEPFSAAKALSRNHTIYALGDAALVVAARDGQGGSWRGATDCLAGGWSPVHVWDGCNADTAGNVQLRKFGALTYSLDRPLGGQLVKRASQTSLFDRT